MAKSSKKKSKGKVPAWKAEGDKRDRKFLIAGAIGKALAKDPSALADLDDYLLDEIVRAVVGLDVITELYAAISKKAGEEAQRKIREERTKAEASARQKEWAEKNGSQLTPKRATAKRANPIGGATPTPHRADGKSLIPKGAPATRGPFDEDDDELPKTSAKAASNGDALDAALPGYLEDEALRVAHANGSVTAGDLLKALPEASRGQATGALARLVTRERLVVTGKGRGTKYTLPGGAGAAAIAESPKNGAPSKKSKPQLELGEAPLS